tara:strand:- start:42 stop:839 length:798 start_codon:yes stop_codon:yes gene_type:complete
MKYFNIRIKPNLASGGVDKLIDSNKTNNPMQAGDLVFDWTEFYIPKGASKLENVSMYMNGIDGGVCAAGDFHLIFARDIDGVAPVSAGTINAAGMTTATNLASNFLGGVVLEGTAAGVGKVKGPSHGSLYGLTRGGGTNNGGGPIQANLLVDGEETLARPGFQRVYVCGVADGAFGFGTGVTADGAVTSDTATSFDVTGTNAMKIFQVGDTVHLHDVNDALGTVKAVTSTSIELNAAIANGTDIANADEIINANPIKILLGFSQA